MGTTGAERSVEADVPSTLVATKLAPPVPLRGQLPRIELVARLATSSAKFCLIAAPAGWGKTSLLSAWHQAEGGKRPFAFLRLEPADDQVAVFWTYAIAALRTVYPQIMIGADELLRAPGTDPMRKIIPDLVNELCRVDEPTVLVLDDYNAVVQDTIHNSVLYLIDHLPPAMCLVVATRSDPPLPLGRLRASGDMTEIRTEHLSLSVEETGLLLSDRFGLDVDSTSLELLHRRTEGWPAALHLAGLSLQGEAHLRDFIERFAGDDRNVADYLTGEVLGQVSDSQRTFLLHTSLLDHLNGPLCDAVVGMSGSAAMLEELERCNLFMVPLDNQRSWYRYHQLFQDWLRHQLRRTEPDIISELHARASNWYAEKGLLEPAISHAFAAGDTQLAAELMNEYLADAGQVRLSAFWRWLAELPEEFIEEYPMIAAERVVLALASGDFSAGSHWVDIAESAIETAPDELRSRYATTVALCRASYELATGDHTGALVRLQTIADQERPARSGNYAIAMGLAGVATFWSVGALEAIPALREGAIASESASFPDGGVTALLAAAYAEIGDWSAAEAAAAAAFALPSPPESYEFPDGMAAHYAMGRVLVARGERDEAIAHLQRGLEMARSWVEPVFVAYGCVGLADGLDDYGEQRALVREARQLLETSRDPGRVGDLVMAAERKLSIRRPTQRTAGTVHVDPLTDRERDVLRLLRSELSLREIANELYISYNTVKGYSKSIYRKLGVSSREGAVATARDLDVL